jgi:hypothetical protein
MTKLRALLAGALLALAFAGGYAWAQQLTSRTLTGLETWQAGLGGPGGTSQFITTGQIRNSQGVITTAQTSGTLTPVVTSVTASIIYTAASVSTTIQLPPLPFDGEIFEIVNGSAGAFTQCTVTTTDGSSLQGATTTGALAAAASTEWRYVLSTNTWYKLR